MVTRSFYRAAVERTVARITGSLDAALDLSALAKEAALSPFHFHRVFRGMIGETPLEMHRRLRLERAASRLLAGDTTVTTIAFEAGYETHEAFTRAFRQAYGASPSAFRELERRPKFELAARSGIHFGEITTIRFMEGESIMDVVIENMPALRVAAVHHVGTYSRISEAFARLGESATPLLRPDAMMLAIYHDDPETTPVDQLHSEAGVTVTEEAALPEGLVELRLHGGRYARTTHIGPYGGLGDVWARFMGEWLPNSGSRFGDGPSFEVYRNNPQHTAPHELRTDLYLPLA